MTKYHVVLRSTNTVETHVTVVADNAGQAHERARQCVDDLSIDWLEDGQVEHDVWIEGVLDE